MAQDTITKQANGLVTLYMKMFDERYGRKPQLNRYREKWGFQDMITDLGYDRAKEIVEYYFKTSKPGHPVAFLLNNYDKINGYYDEKKNDDEKRRKLRADTAARVREWEEAHGQ
jgi:hypothetical protein